MGFCPAEVRPHMQCCIQIRDAKHRKDMDLLVQIQEATKLIRRIEHFSYGKRLRDLGLLSLEKKRLRSDLIVAFQKLKGAYKMERDYLQGLGVIGQGLMASN